MFHRLSYSNGVKTPSWVYQGLLVNIFTYSSSCSLDGIKKWQGRGDDRLIGKQQLDQFPKKIRELADDYLELQEAKPYQVLKEDIDVMKKLNE